jgi:hypothetical protein
MEEIQKGRKIIETLRAVEHEPSNIFVKQHKSLKGLSVADTERGVRLCANCGMSNRHG